MRAYSKSSGIRYPTFEALVEAEANGYLCIALITNSKGRTWPYVVGPFETEHEAVNARRRLHREWKKEDTLWLNQTYKFFIRPAWKEGGN